MSDLVRTQPPVPRPPVEEARALVRDRIDRDAALAALVAVLLAHLLVIWLSPRRAPVPEPLREQPAQHVNVELLPPLEVEDEPEFVRANPEAPTEVPEDTRNYSNRDQVAAQEEAALPNEENLPLVEGDREDSNRIVQGSPWEPPPMPDAASQQQSQDQESAPEMQPAPNTPPALTLPDVREDETEAEEGIVSLENPQDNPETPEDEPTELAELNPREQQSPLDGQGDAQTYSPPRQSQTPAPQPREPRPDRPRLPDNSFGPLMQTFTGVSRSGHVAIDTRYSEFGVYWNRVLEAIERRWNVLVSNNYRSIQFNRQEVTIEFVLSRDGSVSEVRVVASSVGRLPETLSLDAIRSPAPFPEWTPEMIAQMGTSTSKQITFIY